MLTLATNFSSAKHYNDGIRADYSTMIRLWSAFDRSVNAFNKKCGVVTKVRHDGTLKPLNKDSVIEKR